MVYIRDKLMLMIKLVVFKFVETNGDVLNGDVLRKLVIRVRKVEGSEIRVRNRGERTDHFSCSVLFCVL